MPQEWFIIVEENEDEEEMLCSCNMIVVDIDFKE